MSILFSPKSIKAYLLMFVRISASDWEEGGWTIDDSVKLYLALKAKGVDLIHASSGGTSSTAKIAAGPGYQVPFAKAIKKQADILTDAVGIIKIAQQAEKIFQNNRQILSS